VRVAVAVRGSRPRGVCRGARRRMLNTNLRSNAVKCEFQTPGFCLVSDDAARASVRVKRQAFAVLLFLLL